LFFAIDQEELKSQVVPSKIDEWMSTASQIATGGRRQVPEDGPDVINSESDSDNEQREDLLTGAYIGVSTDSHGDPKGSAQHLENRQADLLRLQARGASGVSSQASKMDQPPTHEKKATPMNSDNDYQEAMTEDQKRAQKGANRRARKAAQPSAHPMETRGSEKASRAGGLRSGVGSG
jgi:hypothetical protein